MNHGETGDLDQPCNFGKSSDIVHDLVQTKCHQEYSNVELLTLSGETDSFDLPSACICMFKTDLEELL